MHSTDRGLSKGRKSRIVPLNRFVILAVTLLLILKIHPCTELNTVAITSSFDYNPSELVQRGKEEEKGSSRRLLVFCECRTDDFSAFAQGVSRIQELVPTIDARVFTFSKHATNESSTCDGEIEKLITKYGPTTRTDPYMEVFLSTNFYKNCNQTQKKNLATSSKGKWEGSGAHLVPRNRDIQPITVESWGEVFNQHNKACSSNERTIRTYRSKVLPQERHKSCNVIHIPTIIRWAYAIRNRRELDDPKIQNETVGSMLTRRMTYAEAKKTLQKKTRFTSLITLTTWKRMYSTDALVRHALCNLLTKKYKKCERGRAFYFELKDQPQTGPKNTYIAQGDYKFVISMPNEMSDGYLVEKTIHPYLAGALAITASPGIGKYVNGNRPVYCPVPQEPLDYIAKYKREKGTQFMPFNSTPSDWDRDPSIKPIPFDMEHDQDLVDFVSDQLEEALQPCIDEIIRLDQNDEQFISKLMEPFILKYENSMFDGTYVAISILRWLSHFGSSVAFGLEDQIWNLTMPPQTVS